MPLFSVIIPSYNRAAFIAETLRSVDRQEFRDFEAIVVDDGSTDDTIAKLDSFRDRIALFRQDNKGPGAARNLGVKHARGEYIAFLDSDDLWFPWTLATYARIIAEHGRPTLIAGCLRYFQETGELRELTAEPSASEAFADYFSSSKRGLYCGSGQMTVRRDRFLEIGGFLEGNINSEDHDLVMRLGAMPGFVNVRAPAMVGYRQHPEAATKDVSKTVSGVVNLLQMEQAGRYPGGADRARERRRILTRHVRPLTFELIRQNNPQVAWDLYRRTFLWNLSFGRLPFLVAFCLKLAFARSLS